MKQLEEYELEKLKKVIELVKDINKNWCFFLLRHCIYTNVKKEKSKIVKKEELLTSTIKKSYPSLVENPIWADEI